MGRTVVIINESSRMCQFLYDIISGAGFRTVSASDLNSALSMVDVNNIGLIVSDMDLREVNGIEQVSVRSIFARRLCHG